MRKVLIATLMAGVWILAARGVAFADGGPHGGFTATTDGCAGCHRAHTAQGARLLKVDQGTLCFSCHDGTGSTLDAWDGASLSARIATRATGGNPAGINGALKGGGFVFARIDSGNGTTPGVALANATGGVAVTSAHIKFTSNALTPQNIIWGNGAINSGTGKNLAVSPNTPLACGDCHNPHGNGNYRILRPIPNQSGATTGAALPDETTKTYTTANYWTQYSVGVAKPWTDAQMSNWCSTCHTRYLTGNSNNSGDTIFTYRHRSDGNDGMGGKIGAPYGATIFPTQCLQCHVGHGSNAQFDTGSFSAGVAWPGGTTARGNESTLLKINNRGTCVGCHGTSP